MDFKDTSHVLAPSPEKVYAPADVQESALEPQHKGVSAEGGEPTSKSSVPKPAVVAAVGAFDGVHQGHHALLEKAQKTARALGLKLAVFTFSPNPKAFLCPARFLGTITNPARRHTQEVLLKQAGADHVCWIPFTQEVADLEPYEFIKTYLLARYDIRQMYVGENFTFGKDATGTPKTLARFLPRVTVLPLYNLDGAAVSSSAIRKALIAGDIGRANHLLGRSFEIEGEVIHGAKRGRTLGFPTANILVPLGQVGPQPGVYAAEVTLADKNVWPAAVNVGAPPTFSSTATAPAAPAVPYTPATPAVSAIRPEAAPFPQTQLQAQPQTQQLIEAHLIGFSGDLYGQVLSVAFKEKIRSECRFSSPQELAHAIKLNTEQALHILEGGK